MEYDLRLKTTAVARSCSPHRRHRAGGAAFFAEQGRQGPDVLSLDVQRFASLGKFAGRAVGSDRAHGRRRPPIPLEDVERGAGERARFLYGLRPQRHLPGQGVLRPDDYNARILLLLNGHRLNDNLYGAGLLGKEFLLDLDLVERIEMVRGPSDFCWANRHRTRWIASARASS